jgi:hypothetical protein
LVKIPNQGNEYVLNATGESQIKEYLHDVTIIFDQVNATLRTLIASAKIATGLSGVIPGLQIIGNIFGTLFHSARQTTDSEQMQADAMGQSLNSALHPDRWPKGVPYFASGGIINSPTLGVIGESGPEAILPLSGESTLDDLATGIANLNSFLMYAFSAGTPGGARGSVGAGYGGSVGGRRGLISGGGSGSMNTIFGPGVWGDQPGQRNYDWDSYHGIGHIHGVPFALGAGSVAMHADYAEGVLHLKPGQWFTNPRDGKRQRWMDTSGSGNDQNIDEFVPGNGTTVHVHINAIDSKSFEGTVKQHAKVIQKHLDQESSKNAKLNAKGLA